MVMDCATRSPARRALLDFCTDTAARTCAADQADKLRTAPSWPRCAGAQAAGDAVERFQRAAVLGQSGQGVEEAQAFVAAWLELP